LRAILLERGIVVPQGKRKLEQYLVMLMEEEEGRGRSARIRMRSADMRAQWLDLDRRIASFEAEFTSFAKALPYVAERDTVLGRWAKALLARVHPNVAAVALANKLVRICWAVLRGERHFAAKGAPLAA
jgi:hypothetical protein